MSEEHIVPDEQLSPEELEARKKGLELAQRIDHLMTFYTDERIRSITREVVRQELDRCQQSIINSVRMHGSIRGLE